MNAPATDRDPSTRRPGAVRRVSAAVLVVIGCVLTPLGLVAVWTRTTLLDTDEYVATVGPLAGNHDVQEAGASRITARVMQATDLSERLEESLPPRAANAAPAVTAAVEQVVHDAAFRLLSSERFATVWENANRRAHAQIVAALTGSGNGAVELDDGKVTVDLSTAAERVRARLEELGFEAPARTGERVDPTIELFDASWLGEAQEGVDLLQTLAWVLPVLALLCFAGAIGLSGNRRRTVLRIGLGVAAGMAVVLVALNVARGPYLDLFPRADGRAAGGAAYDQVLHDLRLEARAVFALGIVVAIAAWLSGPSPAAVRVRRGVSSRGRAEAPGELAAWVGRSKRGLRVLVIGAGVVALIASDQLSGWVVLAIAIAVLALLALVEYVGRPLAPPAADRGQSSTA